MDAKSERGRIAYLDGASAEDTIARAYQDAGHQIAARRWRGKGGEIDLILRKGEELIFVEVKKAKTLAAAAERLSMRQVGRIFAAATEFLADQPLGQLTPVRVDFAFVDSTGRHDVIENIQPA